MKSPGSKTTGAGAMYGMAASIPDRSIVGDLTKAYLDAFYDSTNWFLSQSFVFLKFQLILKFDIIFFVFK